MKISILTPTWERAGLLRRLYTSIVINLKYGVEAEWIIMDDGSTDSTNELIKDFQSENILDIKYFRQKNQGKMSAINNIVNEATGDLIIECDSDDYFSDNAFLEISKAYEKYKEDLSIYGICFLKYDQASNNIGQNMKNEKSTMFNLYFKEGETGEKAIVYFSDIRKKYKYKLENNEKFVTEARMHHEMDLEKQIACINVPIMICEYQVDGYTRNIKKVFKQNPYGYYEYFKEIFKQDFTGILENKRIYIIKHYILFSVLTKAKKKLKYVKGLKNKILFIILYIPGMIKTKMQFK